MFLRNFDNFIIAAAGFCHHRNTNSPSSSHPVFYNSMSGTVMSGGSSSNIRSNAAYFKSRTSDSDDSINFKSASGIVGPVLLGTSSGSSYVYIAGNCAAPLTDLSLCMSTGTSTPTYGDYKLDGTPITLGDDLVIQNQIYFYDSTNRCFIKRLVCTFTNSTGSDITIGQWGIWLKTPNLATTFNDMASYNPNNCYATTSLPDSSFSTGTKPEYAENNVTVLMYKEKLSQALTVEAGTTATLTFDISYPRPNHPDNASSGGTTPPVTPL